MRSSDGESFRQDRDNNTPPDFDDPYEVKIAWQKKIQRMWQDAAHKEPSAIWAIPVEDQDRWWTCPDALPPHVQAARIKKAMGK